MTTHQDNPHTMEEVLNPGVTAGQDPNFPNAPIEWRKEHAIDKAQAEGITLSDDHWNVISALQEYFVRHEDKRINTRELHDALDEKFHTKGGITYLYELLPGGPIAQGCRLAGLEAPAGAVNSSFGSVV